MKILKCNQIGGTTLLLTDRDDATGTDDVWFQYVIWEIEKGVATPCEKSDIVRKIESCYSERLDRLTSSMPSRPNIPDLEKQVEYLREENKQLKDDREMFRQAAITESNKSFKLEARNEQLIDFIIREK